MLFHNDKRDHRDLSNETLPLLPLRELIAFPHEVYPILVGRQKSIKALEAAEATQKPILLVAQKDARVSARTSSSRSKSRSSRNSATTRPRLRL